MSGADEESFDDADGMSLRVIFVQLVVDLTKIMERMVLFTQSNKQICELLNTQ